MSSKRGSHDVVAESGEAKMESSAGEEVNMDKAALFSLNDTPNWL